MDLAQPLEATLFVMPLPLASKPTLDWDELRSLVDRLDPRESTLMSVRIPEDPTTDVPRSLSETLQSLSDVDIDLVTVGMPPNDGWSSPLDVDSIRALIERLPCPTFIFREEEPGSVRRLLVPTDLSDHALRAFQHTVALARLYGASVDVLHVVESAPYVALTRTDRLSFGPTPLSEHRGHRRLRAFLREGQVSDVPVRSHLVYGDPAEQIGRFAEEKAVDLLVLSSHQTETHSRQTLGLVAKRVLKETEGSLFVLHATDQSLLSSSS